MKLKKIAVRGLIALAIFVALCMFFSGTITSITTPKIRYAQASRGKLEQRVDVNATLTYPEPEEVRLDVEAGQTLTIVRVDVREGYAVKAGDTVIEACVTGYEAAYAQAQSELSAAQDALLEVERKNAGVVLRRSDESYAEAYAELRRAAQATDEARLEMEAELTARGMQGVDEGYPAGADATVTALVDAYRAAAAAQQTAQDAFDRVARYGVDDTVWAYISERQSAQEKKSECENKLLALESQNRLAAAITAPHDGYIAAITAKAGDTYDGTTILYTLTAADSAPVLRADLTSVTQNVSEGTNVVMTTNDNTVLESKVSATGYTQSGAHYADVTLTSEMIEASGSIYRLSQAQVKLTLLFKSKNSTCLLPASAVRGGGKDRYVYVVNETTGAFGAQKLQIAKQKVNVIAEANGIASIEEDMSYYKIAYMEDREISEGSAVMAYES